MHSYTFDNFCVFSCDALLDAVKVHVPASGEGHEASGATTLSPRQGGNFCVPVGMQSGDPTPLGMLWYVYLRVRYTITHRFYFEYSNGKQITL